MAAGNKQTMTLRYVAVILKEPDTSTEAQRNNVLSATQARIGPLHQFELKGVSRALLQRPSPTV